jgi:hypothetical protein
METRKIHVITNYDRHPSGDAAYGRAFAKFGQRPVRSFVKLMGFLGLACGVAATQSMVSNPFPAPTSVKVMIPIFFVLAAVGLGLWLVDSVRKHPQVYADVLKAIGILLIIGYVAHRIREYEVNVIADGVNRAEGRHHDGW